MELVEGGETLEARILRTGPLPVSEALHLIFGWSFYRQGTSEGTSSADEFLDAALTWFGDPDPRLGTAWEKGERLAKLIAHRRTLLVLDGLCARRLFPETGDTIITEEVRKFPIRK